MTVSTELVDSSSLVRPATQALLRCVARSAAVNTARVLAAAGQATVCGGRLVLVPDASHLVCIECSQTYPLVSQAPYVLPPGSGHDHYEDDEIIQVYYEAHYGPFIAQSPELRDRLTFPHPARVSLADTDGRSAEGEIPVEPFAAVRWQRNEWERERISLMYRKVAPLVAYQELTETYYQCMLDLCHPYVGSSTTVLDLGCGLGRMSVELARLGAEFVVGIDRSPRMVEEAQRILRTPGPVPITLNQTGKQCVQASLALPWRCPANLDFIVGDALCLPVQSAAIDLIMCVNVLDRVPHPRQLVQELGRVVRPGGYLVIADPYHWEEQYTGRDEWVADMKPLFASGDWRRVREVDGVPFVLRYYSRRVTVYMNHCLVFQKVSK